MFDNFHKNKWPRLKVTQASHQKCLYKTKIPLTQDHTYKIVLGSSTGKDFFSCYDSKICCNLPIAPVHLLFVK